MPDTPYTTQPPTESGPLWTHMVPREPGRYYFRREWWESGQADFVEISDRYAKEMMAEYMGRLFKPHELGGEWGPKIPSPEELAAYWRTKQ